MADFSSLKQTILAYIKQNGDEEITGKILQDVLLAMVSTMGDSAINGLASALQDEINARQNQDGTLQSNINSEAQARGNADMQLQNAINAINTYLAKGYVFAGVATPTGTPVSGRVFYVATTAGRYTSFGNLQVQNGISILLVENGSWTLHQLLVVDLSLAQDSNNPVSGGAVYRAIQHEEEERNEEDERLQNNINNEKNRAVAAENVLHQEINNEKNRAVGAENRLHQEINNEKSRAVGAENRLHQEIVAETDARIEEFEEERDVRRQEIQGMRDDVLDLIHEYRPIVIEGNVVNAPDEEDITQQPNNLLKFKDKDYNPTIFSGLGRKYLRKNIIINEDYTSFDGFEVNPEADAMLEGQPDSIFWDRLRERFIAEKDGVYYLDWQDSGDYIPVSADKIYVNENIPYFWNGEDLAVDDDVIARYGNILTQEMISDANTIYVIQYDYNLNGATITIPENCILEFDGGSINNGKCIGNNTKLVGYDGTSTGLYGLYYDINGNLLEFSYKEPCDFKVNLNKTISNDVYGLLPYNYQSMVRYENYIFLIGHPVSDGTRHIRIQLFNATTFEYVGETDTGIYCHANGATVKDDSLMIAGSNGDINLYIIDCDDIISLCGSGTAVANATIDLTYLEEAIGYTGTFHTVQAIDYDAEKKEFAINISGNNIVITDNNLNYIRTGCTSVIDTVKEQYKLPVGLQDLAYKNGIVYINAMRTSKPSGGSYYNPSYHLICLIIDSISGTIIGYQEPDVIFGDCEPQGLFKDADGYIWTNLLKWGDGATSSIRVYNICKLACHKLPQNDLYPLVNSDGKRNTLVDSNKSVPIYIDNSTTNTIQDGSNVYPYKTFNQAYFSTINSGKNITFYFKGSEEEYNVVMGTVIAKNIKLRNYSGTAKIALSADFINCSVDIQDIRVICRNKYNVTDSHISDDTFYACLKITNTSVIIRNSAIEYIDALDQDDARGNIGLIYSRSGNVVVERCSFSNIRYIICEAFGITGKFSNSSFSNVGHLLLVQKNTLAANIEITDCYTISTIDKLIKAAVSVLSATQSIFMYGSTVNNALNAIVVAHKTDVSRAVCYEQSGNTVTNVETFDELAEYVKQPLIDTFGNDVQTVWSYKGYLGAGVYNYIDGYFYNITKGQRLGTRNSGTTSQRLDNTKQPFPNLSGSTYYDYTLKRTFVWQENHYQEIYADDNAYTVIGDLVRYVNNNITPGILADGTDLNTLLMPTEYLCTSAASARSMINAPVSVETSYRLKIVKTATTIKTQIVIPNNSSGIYYRYIRDNYFGLWYRIASQAETYKQKGSTSERPAMSTSPTPNSGRDLYNIGYYYFDTTLNKPIWWNGNGWVDANGNNV